MSAGPDATARGGRLGQLLSYAVIFALAAWLFWEAGDLPASRWEPLGAGTFPRLVLGALGLLAATALVRELRLWRREGGAVGVALGPALVRYRLVVAVLGFFLVYVALLPQLGFSLASLVFLLATQLVLGPKTPRAIAVMLIVALVFSFGLNWLFAEAFNVFLPRGRIVG
jgi:hypothetical protein